MKQMGQRSVKFGSKVDVHPRHGYINFWEDWGYVSKTASRMKAKRELLQKENE